MTKRTFAATILATSAFALAFSAGHRPATADEVACRAPQQMAMRRPGVERQLRQLYLDLIGRPPNMDEYREIQQRGAIDDAVLQGLMSREDFYARMKDYHRALLRSNVSAAVYRGGNVGVSEMTDGVKPFELRSLGSPRGGLSQGCDHFISQVDCAKEPKQDPHLEYPTKTCFDAYGVPQPVSVDYDLLFFKCDVLDAATNCQDAIEKGVLPAKLLYFCDNRRVAMGALKPHLCLPDPKKTGTQGLLTEVVEDGKVVAFTNPDPTGGALARLDRCALGLQRGASNGMYNIGRGCVQREGWIMTKPPYWDATGRKEVAACAIDAQERTVNPVTGATCEGGERFVGDRSCGCGPRFRRCESGDGKVHDSRIKSINEEPLLIADSVVRRDENYFSMLTTRRSFTNGVLSTMYEMGQGVGSSEVSMPVDKQALPRMEFTTPTNEWREYLRGPQHAGVLTTSSFLLRYPTQRARVSHFWEAFLCKSFAPPPDASLPPAEDACNRENNLAKRCGCNHCHATIEPTGAHWGRYGERNAVYLDPSRYTKYDPRCRDCALSGNTACDGQCGPYVMQAFDGDGAASLGLLKTYLYRTTEDEANIEAGPRLLVDRMMQTGDLERCAVKNLWHEFLGRAMTTTEQNLYMKQLVTSFAGGGFKVKDLLTKLLSTDAYRRID